MNLTSTPRCSLAHLPTPFEPLPRLSQHLGGPNIYVKRDDQTGLALGGNKARKLEFLLADALQQECDTIVTTGGPQSNHARQTAAAAARLGLRCELILPRVVPYDAPEYETSGNLLLDHLFYARIELCATDAEATALIEERLQVLTREGHKPYSIPVGGSTPLGALGYVAAAGELLDQASRLGIAIDHIVLPTGSGGTHAGILAGLAQTGQAARVHGIAVSGTRAQKEDLVGRLLRDVLEQIDVPTDDLAHRVQVGDRFVGPGYGLPTDAMLEALELTSRLEGLLLDPVYTGKAMAGLIAAVRAGEFAAHENVVFWHTGGVPALFAYQRLFDPRSSVARSPQK